MKNNSECALKVNYILYIIVALVMMGTSIHLFSTIQDKTQIAKENEENMAEEVQVAELSEEFERDITLTTRSEVERKVDLTSRSEIERNIISNVAGASENLKYKTIDEIEISRNMDLTQRCGISRQDFITLMENLKVDYSGFFGENAGIIYDLCEKYEINEIFFCGLIAGESGWNICSNHKNTNNYISMMSGGKLIKYATPEEGLEAAAKLLHNKYLTPGGGCYYGKTLSSVQKCFCPNSSTWVGLIYGCMKQVVK